MARYDRLATQPTDASHGSALGPLRLPVFRMLWLAWFAANTTMWMNEVAAAWLMTSLAPTPLWVALVQAASTLPVFLLGLPSGALADIVDRRRYFMVTQFWVAGIASVLCIAVLLGWMNAPLLLALTFANGVGMAMRWPVFAAIMPEVLPRSQLPQGLALNGIAMNGSRIVGPLVAGAVIASVGTAWVFVLNALLSLIAGFIIMRWRREHKESPLGRERLTSAMRVGLQYVRQSYRMRLAMLRVSLFFLHSTAIMALLPLLARALPGGGPATFTLLLSSMGAGAIAAALLMPRIRRIITVPQLLVTGTVLQALSAAALAHANTVWIAVPTMFISGTAWISTANSLTLSAQMALPDWVRARGMSIYQMAIMGATATGAALWGQIATVTNIHDALLISAASAIVTMALAYRLMPDRGTEEDLTPANVLKVPDIASPQRSGRVMVSVEYLIDPERSAEFLELMEHSRRSRLQQGALEWQLLHDLGEPGRYVEQVVDESWTEHLRRFDRLTATDAKLREQRLKFHIGNEPPRVTRYLLEQL
ncbi:MFS transporter [Ramlibacter sp. AW1]|uniref:MFS transporter n=1 Tax=Ramlibacter aurantiacus TaxID=2801330 RepID=A0A937D5S4_9BURK|nr:MFS transporter [Ramlibacter aurantiacus]MBL0420218.1 MFS transporter [Ramlibacter aurantiacus]